MITLPTKPTPRQVGLSGKTFLLYGAAKVGKSTFASQLPKPLFLATEAGLSDLEVHQVQIRKWADMLEACALLASGKHDFKSIVIDTVDNAYGLCSEKICEDNGIVHESDMEMGKGWALVRSEFRRVIMKLATLPYGVWMISHTTEKQLKDRTGSYAYQTVSLPGKAGDLVIDLSDVVLFCDFEERRNERGEVVQERVIRTRGGKYFAAGARIRSKEWPETIPLEYEAFRKAFEQAQAVPIGLNTIESSFLPPEAATKAPEAPPADPTPTPTPSPSTPSSASSPTASPAASKTPSTTPSSRAPATSSGRQRISPAVSRATGEHPNKGQTIAQGTQRGPDAAAIERARVAGGAKPQGGA